MPTQLRKEHSLKERKKREQEEEARTLRALSCRKRQLADAKRDSRRKKKTTPELLSLLALHGILAWALRPAEDYVPRSHNLDRQLYGLLDHLFVKYPVPEFMYQTCIAEPIDAQTRRGGCARNAQVRARLMHRRWFLTLAQGGSFPKAAKGILTSREAVAFLRAPAHRTVAENIWWAKMTVAGVPDTLIGALTDRVFISHPPEDPSGRLSETIQFYARHHGGLTAASRDAVTDFVAHKLRHDPEFRLAGRTAGSAVKLSDEWHRHIQQAKLGWHIEWRGLGLADWVYEAKDEVWFADELRTNKELVSEGRKQKHCVYSYVPWCVEGRSFIVSLRGCRKYASEFDAEGKPIWDREFETRRVTIEVSPSRSIVQVRGPLNRAPSPDESAILRRWAGEKGITLR